MTETQLRCELENAYARIRELEAQFDALESQLSESEAYIEMLEMREEEE
jgi:hypothetical protein